MSKHEVVYIQNLRERAARINMLQRIERNRLDGLVVGRHRAPYEPRHTREAVVDLDQSFGARMAIEVELRNPGYRAVGRHRAKEGIRASGNYLVIQHEDI